MSAFSQGCFRGGPGDLPVGKEPTQKTPVGDSPFSFLTARHILATLLDFLLWETAYTDGAHMKMLLGELVTTRCLSLRVPINDPTHHESWPETSIPEARGMRRIATKALAHI